MADSSKTNLPVAANDGDGPTPALSPYQDGSAQPGMAPDQAGGMSSRRRDMGGFEPPIEDEEGVRWSRYLAALHRYKWLILLLTVLGTGAGAVVSRFIDPEYVARATIWIETGPVVGGAIRPRELLRANAWQELLVTGVVLDSVALKLKLYLTPELAADSALFETFDVGQRHRPGNYVLRINPRGNQFTLVNEGGATVSRGELGDTIGKEMGFHWVLSADDVRPNQEVAFLVTRLRDVSNLIRANLSTGMVRDGNFLRVSYKGPEPQQLPIVLNAVTVQFVSVAAGQKQLQLSTQANALEEQLKVAAANLATAETRLQRFRIETITLPRENAAPLAAGLQMTEGPVMTSFFNQQLLLDQVEQDAKAIRSTLTGIANRGLRMDALLAVQSVRSSQDLSRALSDLSSAEATLRSLQLRFTDEHKLVKDARDGITVLRDETIPPLVSGLLAQLEAQSRTLESRIATAAAELQRIPERTITEQRLQREKTSAENLVQMLQNSYETTKLSLQSAIPDLRLLDAAAVPNRPTSNTAPIIVLVGFAAGLVLSIGLAILFDHLDKRFRYPEQVMNELGLTILGAVPAIRKLKNGTRAPEEASQVIEAFRTVRLALTHSYGTAGPIMLTVSSPGPGDGKSLVSSNLALSFAEAGYNTLLVDGDIRRGELHRMFDIDRQPGLLDYLTKEANLEDVIRHPQRGLALIPCGTRRHLGPELLGSPVMGELIASFKTRFDVVIVDSPPLGAGIDPFILSTVTGNMLLVLRSGETDRAMAEEKLKLADRLPIRILGAILNDVQTKQRAYRYYNYVYGYTPEDGAILELPAGVATED